MYARRRIILRYQPRQPSYHCGVLRDWTPGVHYVYVIECCIVGLLASCQRTSNQYPSKKNVIPLQLPDFILTREFMKMIPSRRCKDRRFRSCCFKYRHGLSLPWLPVSDKL